MAEYLRREVTPPVRVVYTLPTPSNWTEIAKLMSSIRAELADGETFDDTVTVESDDEELRFWFEKPEQG